MSAWGGPHPEPPPDCDFDICRAKLGGFWGTGLDCGKAVVWFLILDPDKAWRVGFWSHTDGSPQHQLFTHGPHPSTVAVRPHGLE